MKILITGGSSGLGRAIVKKLKKDNNVFFTFFSSKCDDSSSIHLDLENNLSITHLTNWIQNEKPDVIINNAIPGYVKNHSHKITGKDHSIYFNNCISGTVDITNAFIKMSRKRKSGKIINVISSYVVGKHTLGMSQYIAQKNYLLSMSKSWASENISFGISSNSISPSMMKTDFIKDIDKRVIEQVEINNPLKRLISINEVADVVLFMCKITPFYNGENLILNCGEN